MSTDKEQYGIKEFIEENKDILDKYEKAPATRRGCILCGTTTWQIYIDGKWQCEEHD